MEDSIGIFDVIGLLGLFIIGFVMWVAWELIIGNKFIAVFLAIGTFVATWTVAKIIGADSVLPLMIIQAVMAGLLVRVANKNKGKEDA